MILTGWAAGWSRWWPFISSGGLLEKIQKVHIDAVLIFFLRAKDM
jgi:hypothetical protein